MWLRDESHSSNDENKDDKRNQNGDNKSDAITLKNRDVFDRTDGSSNKSLINVSHKKTIDNKRIENSDSISESTNELEKFDNCFKDCLSDTDNISVDESSSNSKDDIHGAYLPKYRSSGDIFDDSLIKSIEAKMNSSEGTILKEDNSSCDGSKNEYWENAPVVKLKSPTRITKLKSEMTKFFFSNNYRNLMRQHEDDVQRANSFNEQLYRAKLSPERAEIIKNEYWRKSSECRRLNRKKPKAEDFEKISIIGKGAFGDVYLVKEIDTGRIFAMKIMFKVELATKNQILNTYTEKEVLETENNKWFVRLYYTFCDSNNIYFVMEFMPGGDMMTLLMDKGYFTEDETRFFVAETLLAIHEVHKAGFIHRDIKPDNILFNEHGHIRLSDFGLSAKIKRDFDPLSQLIEEVNEIIAKPELAFEPGDIFSETPRRRRDCICSTVGSPDYIAPEVLRKFPYDHKVDFWALGAIMYEMFYGFPPFRSTARSSTAINIIRWKESLGFEAKPGVSDDAIDLMKKLLCDAQDRLDFEEIKDHRFFDGIDWEHIRDMESPYQPEITSPTDTKHFEKFQPREEPEDGSSEVIDIAFSSFSSFPLNRWNVQEYDSLDSIDSIDSQTL